MEDWLIYYQQLKGNLSSLNHHFLIFLKRYIDSDLPQHPCLKLIGNSEQYLARKLRRRLITMEKVKEYEKGLVKLLL